MSPRMVMTISNSRSVKPLGLLGLFPVSAIGVRNIAETLRVQRNAPRRNAAAPTQGDFDGVEAQRFLCSPRGRAGVKRGLRNPYPPGIAATVIPRLYAGT